MQADILVGLQFGDEGKGKIIDYLVAQGYYSAVARWAGGSNAGHTLYHNGKKLVLHLLPSGVLDPNVRLYLGSQMVIDLAELDAEIKGLEAMGIEVLNRLFISKNAHVIFPEHKRRDALNEQKNKIGTTLKGIGPTYTDKAARTGKRLSDLGDTFWENNYNHLVRCLHDIPFLICNEKRVLCEGAQGYSLDIDHGTYPYVTSSNTIASSACVSLGFSPKCVNHIFGVTKSYTTRVGEGPFPTEMDETLANVFREIGHEYGATTGRPRRVGWLDLTQLREACIVNGVTDLIITKMDTIVQSPTEEILLVDYRGGLKHTVTSWHPEQAQHGGGSVDEFIKIIEKATGTRTTFTSHGPNRDDIRRFGEYELYEEWYPDEYAK